MSFARLPLSFILLIIITAVVIGTFVSINLALINLSEILRQVETKPQAEEALERARLANIEVITSAIENSTKVIIENLTNTTTR